MEVKAYVEACISKVFIDAKARENRLFYSLDEELAKAYSREEHYIAQEEKGCRRSP